MIHNVYCTLICIIDGTDRDIHSLFIKLHLKYYQTKDLNCRIDRSKYQSGIQDSRISLRKTTDSLFTGANKVCSELSRNSTV